MHYMSQYSLYQCSELETETHLISMNKIAEPKDFLKTYLIKYSRNKVAGSHVHDHIFIHLKYETENRSVISDITINRASTNKACYTWIYGHFAIEIMHYTILEER